MFLNFKNKKTPLFIVIALAIVLFAGALKMLADQSIELKISVDDGSVGPSVPVTPVVPIIPPTTPVEPIVFPITQPTIPSQPPTKVVPPVLGKPAPIQQPQYEQGLIMQYGGILKERDYLFLLFLAILLLADLILLWMAFFFFEKRVVYDSFSKKPIPGAKVSLLDRNKKILETVLTDSRGIFNFRKLDKIKNNGKSFTFFIKVVKPGYIFPSKTLKAKKHDGLFYNLYFGEKLQVKNPQILMDLEINIPMDMIVKKTKRNKS